MAEFAQILIRAKDETRAAFASAQRNLQQVGDGVERLRSRLKSSLVDVASIATSIGAGLSVRALSQMADEFASLQARLKLASRDVNEFNAANADLVRIADTARAPLAETATLYTRIAASVKDLNVSQEQIAGTTEAVALALRISGASAAESSSAMLQFSQAIASGVLRGEEFNAVNESAPRLLQALAASLKVPVGELRDMAKAGQLTRDVLINGLLNQLPRLQQEAVTLPQTIGSAFTDLNNKLLLTVGEIDKITGAVGSVSNAISSIGTTGIEALAVSAANVVFVFKAIGNEIGGIGAQLARLAVGDFKGFSEIGRMMREDAVRARKELDEFERRILGIGAKAQNAASSAAADAARPVLPLPKAKAPRTGTKADPLASLLGSTDIGRTQEYNRLLGLLDARFAGGKKNAELYAQAVAKLNEQFGKIDIDPLGSGSFKTTSKDAADFIRDQQDAINALNAEMAQDGVQAAQAFDSALQALISDTTIAKTAALHEQVALLDRALFDGAIGAEQHAEALKKLTEGTAPALEKTKSLAEDLGLTFSSAFENAIVSGGKLSDILKGIEQDIIRIITRKMVTEPLGNFLTTAIGAFVASADGNVFAGAPGLSAYSGSVVSKPTLFAFANGIGLMGEAGDEAILPLKRGSNGKLGVQSSGGGGTTVVMNISTPDANSFRASEGQITAQYATAMQRARRNL